MTDERNPTSKEAREDRAIHWLRAEELLTKSEDAMADALYTTRDAIAYALQAGIHLGLATNNQPKMPREDGPKGRSIVLPD